MAHGIEIPIIETADGWEYAESVDNQRNLPETAGQPASPAHPLAKSVQDPDVQEYIALAVEFDGKLNPQEAADQLDVDRSTIWRWNQLPGMTAAMHKAMRQYFIPMFPVILRAQWKQALKGKTRAAEFVRDTLGFKPPEEVNLNVLMQELSGDVLAVLVGVVNPIMSNTHSTGSANVIDAEVLEDGETESVAKVGPEEAESG